MKKMKKLSAIIICTMMAAAFTACGDGASASSASSAAASAATASSASASSGSSAASAASADSGKEQIANPFTDCKTLAEAEKISGVSISVPTAINNDFSDCTYRAMDSLIEVIYADGKENDQICIRKGSGTKDVSGDYNSYPESEKVTIGNAEVTFKGSSGKVSLAVWTSGDNSYSVYAAQSGTGIAKTMMTEIVGKVDASGSKTSSSGSKTPVAASSVNNTAVLVSTAAGSEKLAKTALGGWKFNQGKTSLSKNPAAMKAFKKAVRKLTGCEYKPIALLATQTVSGTNYCILCRTTAVVPHARSTYSLVYVYQNLKGHARITSVSELELGSTAASSKIQAKTALGGWKFNQSKTSLSKNPAAMKAFKKAVRKLDGCEYKPIALLGSQTVSCTNYCILCRTTAVVPHAKSTYSLVYVYQNLKGHARITSVSELDIAGSAD